MNKVNYNQNFFSRITVRKETHTCLFFIFNKNIILMSCESYNLTYYLQMFCYMHGSQLLELQNYKQEVWLDLFLRLKGIMLFKKHIHGLKKEHEDQAPVNKVFVFLKSDLRKMPHSR